MHSFAVCEPRGARLSPLCDTQALRCWQRKVSVTTVYSDPLCLSYPQALLLNLMEPDFSNLIMNLISMALSYLSAPLVLASILLSSQHLFQPSEDSVDTSRYLNREKGGVKRGATSLHCDLPSQLWPTKFHCWY